MVLSDDKWGPLPPGQVRTRKLPVVGEKASLPVSMEMSKWHLELSAEGAQSRTFNLSDIHAMSAKSLEVDIHCVTGWSRLKTRFKGFLLSDFLVHHGVPIPDTCRFVRFLAYSARGHDTSIPLKLALREAWLIHSLEDRPLPAAHGYPLRLVVPSRYFYKSLKWVKRIEFLKEDQPGFWERTSGYHNEADPWKEQRLDAKRFSSAKECEQFKQQACFDAYRNLGGDPRVIVRADFRGWNPQNRDLRGLHLKSCDFRGAKLQGVHFHGANLTFGQFEGADLSNAHFEETDLEGCCFSGAFLAGARFVQNALSAAQFRTMNPVVDSPVGLQSWKGMQLIRPDGLLEDQEAYLRELGVLE
jgi:DMSO/TMAO reductase YedYZ molybdopterin-dependent catalytic subunit